MTGPTQRPVLGVLYDVGAAGPGEIAGAAREVADVVFVYDRSSPSVAAQERMLNVFGRPCDITGLTDEEAAEVVARARVSHLVTFSELQMRRAAAIASLCGLWYHTPDTTLALTDKLLQRQQLRDADVDVVRCRAVSCPEDVDGAVAAVGFPAVVKPRSGAGSVDTLRVDSALEAERWLGEMLARPGWRRDRGFVVEELLEGDPSKAGPEWGDFVSVESLVQDCGVRHFGITGKFPLAVPFRERGMVFPATISADLASECLSLAEAAIRALGIRSGMTHIEIKLTQHGPRLIEVNGRLGGYVADVMKRSSGCDLVGVAVRDAVGAPVPRARVEPSRVAFQFFVAPPREARKLVSLDGVKAARLIPGVRRIDVFASAGDRLDWRLGTQGYVGIIHGEAASHDEVLGIVRRAERTLAPEYEVA